MYEKYIAILSSQKILRGTLPSWTKSRGEINIFSVPIPRSLIFTPLCFFQWKDRRLLYRSTPCYHQPFWMSGNSGLCDRYWKRTRYKTPVFQHHFPGRLADFLCLAGKRTIKPDRKWQDEIYSAVFVLVPVEHNTDIGIRNIETSYYEQKTFWSFCNYMVRSCKGIEMLVNLINISYCAMKILPYQNEHFSEYRTKSVQEFRFELS